MELGDLVRGKIKTAIGNLEILDVERQSLDSTCWPVMQESPDHTGMILTYMVALLAPCGPDDHVVHFGILWDPYGVQSSADTLLKILLDKVHAEQDQFASKKPASPARGIIRP